MKRLFSMMFVAFLALAFVFTAASCDKKNEDPDNGEGEQTTELSDGLKKAKNYVLAMYKNSAELTTADYDLVAQCTIEGAVYNVAWSVNVTSGSSDDVKVGTPADGKVTIDVNEKAAEDVVYTLIATVSKDGESTTVEFSRKVPKFQELTWAEYVAAEDDSAIVVKGVVTAIASKSNGNSSNCVYFQDNDGGYYSYASSDDPTTLGIKVGMTIRVTGVKDTYSGTYQISSGTYEILDETIATVEAEDFTEVFKNATTLKDAALVTKQAKLVTIKGVTVTDEVASSGYYKFKLGTLETYVRVSSSVCPLSAADQATFKAAHKEHNGWTANVTGVICIYDGAFYLTPVSVDAFEYVSLPEKTDAEAVAFEKENLTLASEVISAGEIAVATKGATYDKVAISWASDNELVAYADGKLTIATMPETTTEVKVAATLTAGETTETKEFTVKLIASKSFIAEAIKACNALENKAKSTEAYIIIGKVAEITTVYSDAYKNVSFTVTDGTQSILIYRYNLEDASTIQVGDFISITGTLQKNNTTLEVVADFAKYDTISIADANAAAAGTDDAAKTGKSVYGQIVKIGTAYSASYNNITFTISDGTDELVCFRVAGGSELVVGDYVIVTGNLTQYSNTNEFAAGATYTVNNKYSAPVELTDADKVAAEKAALTLTAKVTEAGDIAVATKGATYDTVVITWATDNEKVTYADGKLTVADFEAGTTEVKVTATLTLGEATDTKEFTLTLYKETAKANLTIDWADAKVGEAYTSANWTAEQYNSSWDVLTTSQMNCREKDTVKVVNFVSGWSMERRFTYSTGSSLGLANHLALKVGNYFSGAQEFPVKIVALDKDGGEHWICGSADAFEKVPVTTGLIDVAYDFEDVEVYKLRLIVKSPVSGNAYLYCGPITLSYVSNTAELSFADTAKRTGWDALADDATKATKQVWEDNGIKVTNEQGESQNPIANYSNPVRFYINTKVTVECAGMKKVVVDCVSKTYAAALAAQTIEGATITVEGTIVTIEFSSAVDSFTIAKVTKQFRVAKITIYK